MTARVLPPAEWSRLAATEGSALAPAWDQLPQDVTVVVVEDADGAIVACWSLFACLHVEGIWIAPVHRGHGAVFRRLLATMWAEIRGRGVSGFITHAAAPDIVALIEGLHGTRLPGDAYAVPLGER